MIHSSYSQEIALSNRVANYEIDVVLDTSKKTITANERIVFNNPSSDTIKEMQFHVYYNAFKNTKSTFFKSNTFPDILGTSDATCNWSWTEILKIKDMSGNDLSNNWTYIQPDDSNQDDQTVLRLILSDPVLPFDSMTIDMQWEAKIPKIMARTGYNKSFYFFAQWFPKLGVYEPAGMRYAETGGWNCHQYHANGEYYADFGNYKVSMTVPGDFIVAATGELIEKQNTGQMSTWTFAVEDVIDFTWTASPYFMIQEDQFKDTKIQLYSYPSKSHFAARYFRTIQFAMAFLDEKIGDYPYPTLSIIDVPIHGLFTGGMEYPTLISTLGFCFIPLGLKTPETLVTHEFIHQYFMQMIATNEQEEAWLDEGITTYFEGRILDELDGEHTSTIDWLGIKAGNKEFNRAEFFSKKNIEIAEISRFARDFKDGGYDYLSYNKTAVWLSTLEGIIGTEQIDRVFKQYFEQWKFKHPCKRDFIQVVNDVTEDDWTWFFDQVLEGTEECDYALADIENKEIKPDRGFFTNLDSCEVVSDNNVGLFYSKVTIHRRGEMILPVDVEIMFEDGSSRLEYWDGKERTRSFTFKGNQKVVKAIIDPKRKNYIDRNFLNNSMVLEPNKSRSNRLFARFLTAVQHTLASIMLLA